jgi:hypothetical protein
MSSISGPDARFWKPLAMLGAPSDTRASLWTRTDERSIIRAMTRSRASPPAPTCHMGDFAWPGRYSSATVKLPFPSESMYSDSLRISIFAGRPGLLSDFGVTKVIFTKRFLPAENRAGNGIPCWTVGLLYCRIIVVSLFNTTVAGKSGILDGGIGDFGSLALQVNVSLVFGLPLIIA